jgi:hypothetical protein
LVVLVSAAMNALLLAIDGRHRDFPILAYSIPAIAYLVGGTGRDARLRYAEEGWLAGVLIVAAAFSIDHYANMETWSWLVVCLALAAPWLPTLTDELRRLGRALRGSHQA